MTVLFVVGYANSTMWLKYRKKIVPLRIEKGKNFFATSKTIAIVIIR